MIRTTILLSDNTNKMIRDLAKENKTSLTRQIEQAIIFYAALSNSAKAFEKVIKNKQNKQERGDR